MRSHIHGPSPGFAALRHPVASIPSVRRLPQTMDPLQASRPCGILLLAAHRLGAYRLSTPRPAPPHRARSHDPPLQRGPRCPVMPIVDVPNRAPKSQAHGVRHGAWSRLPRVPTPTQRARCQGPGDDSSPHHLLEPAPRGLRHHKPLDRGHSTRRASAGGAGPPQTTPGPLLSVRGCERAQWGSKPLSSIIPHTPKQAGEDASWRARIGHGARDSDMARATRKWRVRLGHGACDSDMARATRTWRV
jgi:hypothetical protein